jgi:hypothetical protein
MNLPPMSPFLLPKDGLSKSEGQQCNELFDKKGNNLMNPSM